MKLREEAGSKEKVLILFDRGYPSLYMMAYMKNRGIEFVIRTTNSFLKETNEVIARESEQDEIKFTPVANRYIRGWGCCQEGIADITPVLGSRRATRLCDLYYLGVAFAIPRNFRGTLVRIRYLDYLDSVCSYFTEICFSCYCSIGIPFLVLLERMSV